MAARGAAAGSGRHLGAGRPRGVRGGDVREGDHYRTVEQRCDEDGAQCADEDIVDSHVVSFAGRVHTTCVAVFDGR